MRQTAASAGPFLGTGFDSHGAGGSERSLLLHENEVDCGDREAAETSKHGGKRPGTARIIAAGDRLQYNSFGLEERFH